MRLCFLDSRPVVKECRQPLKHKVCVVLQLHLAGPSISGTPRASDQNPGPSSGPVDVAMGEVNETKGHRCLPQMSSCKTHSNLLLARPALPASIRLSYLTAGTPFLLLGQIAWFLKYLLVKRLQGKMWQWPFFLSLLARLLPEAAPRSPGAALLWALRQKGSSCCQPGKNLRAIEFATSNDSENAHDAVAMAGEGTLIIQLASASSQVARC